MMHSSSLLEAVKSEDLAEVERLVMLGADVGCRDLVSNQMIDAPCTMHDVS